MRWTLRPNDWHRIWPELIGAQGAPDVPSALAATGADSAAPKPAPDRATASTERRPITRKLSDKPSAGGRRA